MLEICILVLLGIWLYAALRSCRKGSGSCQGCSGCCTDCRGCRLASQPSSGNTPRS